MTEKKGNLVARSQESEKPQVKEECPVLLDDSDSESDEVWTKWQAKEKGPALLDDSSSESDIVSKNSTHRKKKFQKI